MKNLLQLSLILLMTLLFSQCSKQENIIELQEEATILGEWKLEGFENVRYYFTETERFTMYGSADEPWPTFEEFRTTNPGIRGLDWHYDGDLVVIDFNFGHVQRLTVDFTCGDKVLNWTDEDGTSGSKYYRTNHDFDSCN